MACSSVDGSVAEHGANATLIAQYDYFRAVVVAKSYNVTVHVPRQTAALYSVAVTCCPQISVASASSWKEWLSQVRAK